LKTFSFTVAFAVAFIASLVPLWREFCLILVRIAVLWQKCWKTAPKIHVYPIDITFH
jgi:hypothetical protein